MSKQQVFSLTVFMVFLYAMAYYLTDIIPTPIFWYFPLEHRWEFALTPSQGLVMGWYGKVFICCLFALLGTGILALIFRLKQQAFSPAVQAFFDLLAMSSVIFVLYFLARSLALRVL